MDTFRDWWVRLALLAGLAVPVYFAAAALGTKFGLFEWTFGFGQLTFTWGPRVVIGVGAFALLALLVAFFTPPRRGVIAALVALLIPLGFAGFTAYAMQKVRGLPPIHDITTDFVDPPGFSAAVSAARAATPASNGLDLLNKRTADDHFFIDLQREAYPDIAHVSTGLAPDRAFDLALALAREQNWTIGRIDASSGEIEATAESFWFGFIDDIAIRVRADGSGARIDMRSVSRVGRSDLGANAARMRPYLEALRVRLQAVESAG